MFRNRTNSVLGGTGTSGCVVAETGHGNTSGSGLISGRKRARLMPSRPIEKVTPEAGALNDLWPGVRTKRKAPNFIYFFVLHRFRLVKV